MASIKIRKNLYEIWSVGNGGAYTLLILLLFAIFIAPPLINEGLLSQIFLEMAFALILILGVFTIPCATSVRLSTFLIAILAIAARTFHRFDTSLPVAIADSFLAVATLAIFAILLAKRFMIGKSALKYRIAAAVTIYLLLGLLWGRLYEIVYLLHAGSFSIEHNENEFTWIYFSFVTLVTIGYGDIVPVSLLARSLAIFEGVTGQLYMAILISSLISEFSNSLLKAAKIEPLIAKDKEDFQL